MKAKEGGLDVIDTYVFWNVHEPSPGNVLILLSLFCFIFSIYVFSCCDFVLFLHLFLICALMLLCTVSVFQYNFEGRYDLVRFLKIVQKAGLYAHLRIGPYVCAEWNFGCLSFPFFSHYDLIN